MLKRMRPVALAAAFGGAALLSAAPVHAGRHASVGVRAGGTFVAPIRTVFVILMENKSWALDAASPAPYIYQNPQAPYINSLLTRPDVAYSGNNGTPIHPSEPSYVWLEAGTSSNLPNTNAGCSATISFTTDALPSQCNSTSTTNHLTSYLDKAGVSWKAYEEGISGTTCPFTNVGLYAARHNPMMFFQDVTGNYDANNAYCIAHERPYSELATDLTNNTVPRYVFITPNLCDDMHGTGVSTGVCPDAVAISDGDTWLSNNLPAILSSQAYLNDGAVFISWDEQGGYNGQFIGHYGVIAISKFAKPSGDSDPTVYPTHGSLLRTVQEIFGVTPLLGDAASQPDYSPLFSSTVTAAPVARFGAVSSGAKQTRLRWRVTARSGLAGFTVSAGGRTLTRHVIPFHGPGAYRTTVAGSANRHYTLHVLLTGGGQMRVTTR